VSTARFRNSSKQTEVLGESVDAESSDVDAPITGIADS
jgi:hypothetical protein